MMYGYRMVRLENNQIKTIAHGLHGSRILPFNEWLEAEVKWTHNPGSKDQPHYWSGFHVFNDFYTALQYRDRFKEPPTVVHVECDECWEKPTNPKVTLCKYMKVIDFVDDEGSEFQKEIGTKLMQNHMLSLTSVS